MNLEIIKSSILGFIVGDALGVPFEFESREKLKRNPVTKMVGGGSWDQPIGTWSDNNSMVLSTINIFSMDYNLSQLGIYFHHWLYHINLNNFIQFRWIAFLMHDNWDNSLFSCPFGFNESNNKSILIYNLKIQGCPYIDYY